MIFEDALDAFARRQVAQGRSMKTVEVYARSLHQVFGTLERECPEVCWTGVDPLVLDRLLTHPAVQHQADGTPRAPATLHRLKAAVRAFYGWAQGEGLVAENPARQVILHRVPRTPPTFLSDADVRKLRKAVQGRTSDEARRDRVIIELFLGTGVRLHELVMLDVDDVDLDAKHLHVRQAKGGVPQVKFLKTDLRPLLRSYLRWRKGQGGGDVPALFLSNRGTRLSPRQIANRLAYWLQQAGIEKPVTPHGLRHTFATQLYSRTGDLLVVQRALGHRNIATTEIYTHLVDGALEEALERL